MALTKFHENTAGNSGDHWELTHIRYDVLNDSVEIRIDLFKDKAAKDAGKTSMGVIKKVTIKPAPVNMSATMAALLESVKTTKSQDQALNEETPFFSNAV